MAETPSQRPLPFLFGAQYYRAPTPERACWDGDLARMKELGFNAVKFWVQWRWSHRAPGDFFFADLDELMDLAHVHGLRVTLNTIFDVAPCWLYDAFPESMQVCCDGRVVRPRGVAHRQIGGFPGPCYNHAEAHEERVRFLRAAVRHFRTHPAMDMWDVWNEPEQCGIHRSPSLATLVCYCDACRGGFLVWLREKYGKLDRLNDVWGRCYRSWDEVELPRDPHAGFTDMVDWREFHLDTMAAEARWRLDLVKADDPAHVAYLHVVPNTMRPFNAVTCVDDFAMSAGCDIWAGTTFAGPVFSTQLVSAGRGRPCYNVECHINAGQTSMHQRMVDLDMLLADLLPQIGDGIRGFLFWQFRPEVLGREAPAWGLVKPDGSDRPVTRAVETFGRTLAPHMQGLLRAAPTAPRAAVWKSRKNEVFHVCLHGNLNGLADAVDAWSEALYWLNVPFCYVDEVGLVGGELAGIRLLIMPSCYYLTHDQANALDAWVRGGGTVVCEAHLGGYDGTLGRHSRGVPGCGLAARWGFREADSTSTYNLGFESGEAEMADLNPDVRKALDQFGTTGGSMVPVGMRDGTVLWGAQRYAMLAGDGLDVLGTVDGCSPCIACRQVGDGRVVYCGTNLGQARMQDSAAFDRFVHECCEEAGISPAAGAQCEAPGAVHVDVLETDGKPAYLVLRNRTDAQQKLTLDVTGMWHGVFSGIVLDSHGARDISIPARAVDLFVPGNA